jgi:cysteinylglycine-S-conjugate dipeptidase
VLNITEFKKFISYQSIENNAQGNIEARNYLLSRFNSLGFKCEVLGSEKSLQPIIAAHRKGIHSKIKILIYNHYDVEVINPAQSWISGDPFTLNEVNHRLYGRGIADNKGPLLARIEALESLQLKQETCPEILWLIQGEEEIKSKINPTSEIFKSQMASFSANYYIEETGYHDIDKGYQAIFLWSPARPEVELYSIREILNPLFLNEKIRFKYEHLIKFASISPCPFLSNLPKDAIYIGFGPNDRLHNIHCANESLDKAKLEQHAHHFESFLKLISKN